MTIRVRPAVPEDAGALSRLGARTFRETFERDNTPQDMASYLDAAFTPEVQAAEIGASGAVLLAEDVRDHGAAELVGYAHIAAGRSPDVATGPAPCELKRLYVLREWHGRGVAQALMDEAIAAARAHGARTLWLGVWERNPRAIAFYKKYGFERIGEHAFVLGTDKQTDWILARQIDPMTQ